LEEQRSGRKKISKKQNGKKKSQLKIHNFVVHLGRAHHHETTVEGVQEG